MSLRLKERKSKSVRNSAEKSAASCRHILGMRVDCTTYDQAVQKIIKVVRNGGYGYVCVANVHVLMEAYDDAEFRKIVNSAQIVTPDGMPLVWGLKLLGIKNAERVYGPFLTLIVCNHAQQQDIPVGFYGSSQKVQSLLLQNLREKVPSLDIVYSFSPPFRMLTSEEDEKVIREINASGTKILFVGLGCPKQEWWMAEHKDKIPAVMIGVGAAFDFLAGVKPQAPGWMQRIGLEWLFRFITEPRRLWKRYLYNNPRFIYNFTCQLLGIRKYS